MRLYVHEPHNSEAYDNIANHRNLTVSFHSIIDRIPLLIFLHIKILKLYDVNLMTDEQIYFLFFESRCIDMDY